MSHPWLPTDCKTHHQEDDESGRCNCFFFFNGRIFVVMNKERPWNSGKETPEISFGEPCIAAPHQASISEILFQGALLWMPLE